MMNENILNSFADEILKCAAEEMLRPKKFRNVRDLVRWAKKEKIVEIKRMPPQFIGSGEYKVKMKPKRVAGISPLTGRKKKLNVQRFFLTNISPKSRTFRNRPKYASGKYIVRFQDWLLIKTDPAHSGLGYSLADGKWYGWSHRAVSGFKDRSKALVFAKSVS